MSRTVVVRYETSPEAADDNPAAGRAVFAQLAADDPGGLRYDRYIAQGGDFGALASLALATVDHEHVAGAHVNFLPTAPSGDPAELGQLTEPDLARLQRASRFIQDQSGYMKLHWCSRHGGWFQVASGLPRGWIARVTDGRPDKLHAMPRQHPQKGAPPHQT
jgi:hypothetical protein